MALALLAKCSEMYGRNDLVGALFKIRWFLRH
jgi:hypothetical protein